MVKKKRTKAEQKARDIEKDKLLQIILAVALVLFLGVISLNAKTDQITHKFKSPSFNGIATSSHYLTIENQEFNRKQTIKDELKAAIEEAERDKENSTVQRFIRNFESRVYAELSRQLIANLFGETPSDSGVISLEGNTIEYSTDGDFLTLKITEADGTVTVITIPIGSFTF